MENSEEPVQKKSSNSEMRKLWFEYVGKTRKKMAKREKKPVSHRDAMKEASAGWVAEKQKILRKKAREARRNAKK